MSGKRATIDKHSKKREELRVREHYCHAKSMLDWHARKRGEPVPVRNHSQNLASMIF
jgi:hypothetical protein